MKLLKFSKGDKVIVINKSSKHFGKVGVIECLYKKEMFEVTGIRYKVNIDIGPKTKYNRNKIRNYNVVFIINEYDIILTKQYDRDYKLNKLGLD